MTKARLIAFLASLLILSGTAIGRDKTVRVFVDDCETTLKPPAISRNGRTYIGLRAIADALGATVKWNTRTKIAIVTVGNKRTRVSQSKGIMVNGALYLPLRTTGEALGCGVAWDTDEKAVKITTEAPAPRGGG